MARSAVVLTAVAQGEAAPPQGNAAEDKNSGRDEPCFVPGQAREDKAPSRLRALPAFALTLRTAGKPAFVDTSTQS